MTRQQLLRTLLLPMLVPVLLVVLGWTFAGSIDPYQLDVATSLLILLAAAQAWNIMAGFTGQFSLGTSAFIGTGAYATVLAMTKWGMTSWTALLLSGVAGAVLAAFLAPALLRLRGDYFTIGTLAAALAVQAWAVNFDPVGRSSGIDVPFDKLPFPVDLFRIALVVAAVAAVVSIWFAGSRFGLQLSAVGQDQDAAVGLGLNVFRLRLVTFAVSGFLTGAAGAVLALQQVHVEPAGSLGISWTISVVLMTIVGGLGTRVGPLVGVVVIYLGVTKQFAEQPITGLVVQGLILILVVRFAPKGLWPLVAEPASTLISRWRSHDQSPTQVAADRSGEPTAQPGTATDAANGTRRPEAQASNGTP